MTRNVRDRAHDRSGSTLLIVLLFLGVIAILATAIARSISGAALELSSSRSAAETDSDLRAGIELGVAAILNLGDDMRRANATVDLPGRRLTVRVTNERARIDLNSAKVNVLTGLLKAIDVDGKEAEALAANIVEWRGGASEESTASPEHQHLGVTQSVASGPPSGDAVVAPAKPTRGLRFFNHPIQLAMVPGFSVEIVRRLFPLVTVANGANTINAFIAPREVLSALPDVTGSAVDAFMDSRDGNVGHDTAILLLGADKGLLSEERTGGWRLQITSTPRRGRAHHSEVVIAGINGDDDDPYRVLYALDDADQQMWQLRQ
jgi:general secretion pathway protein K